MKRGRRQNARHEDAQALRPAFLTPNGDMLAVYANTAPPPHPVYADDAFQRIWRRPIKNLNQGFGVSGGPASAKGTKIYISLRECNDYYYDPSSLGAVGFTAAGCDEVFLFCFLLPSHLF